MILSALCIGLMSAAHAQDDAMEPLEVRIDDTPIVLKIPRDARGAAEWTFAPVTEPGVEMSLYRYAPPAVSVGFGWWELFQPDISAITVEQAQAFLAARLDRAPETFSGVTLSTQADHPVLGDVLFVDFLATLEPTAAPEVDAPVVEGGDLEEEAMPEEAVAAPQPIILKQRAALYPAEGGIGYVVAAAALPFDEEARAAALALEPDAEGGVADVAAAMETVLGMATMEREVTAEEDLPVGRYEADCGYALEIPQGWRALTDKEMNFFAPERVSDGPYEGRRAARIFVDPATLSPVHGFTCQVYATSGRPIEVLDPGKSSVHGDNFRTHVRASLKGKSFKLTSGGVEETVRISVPMLIEPIFIDDDEMGELSMVSLPNRDGYAWTVSGKRGEDEEAEDVTVAAFYTAWDNLGLNCIAVAGEGEGALLETFQQSMTTFEVLDSDAHPMVLSFMSRYRRWWPYQHPALQLYWLVIPLFLLALVPMFRDWFESRS
ncbi:MAG: hypothetical protein AAFV53_00020 [Myxococcota bacterium]